MNKSNRFARYAWFVLAINIFVILWGAVVRATGSGAGCGSHWPNCNGEIIPTAPQVETLIEFTHRLTSGVALLLVLGLLIWSWRAYPQKHPVRLGAGLSAVFILIEALVGAGLVLFELTGQNDSSARAIVIALHLANTFLLLGVITLTGWWASGGSEFSRSENKQLLPWFLVGFLAVLVIGMSGAVTALGDTLFPAESLSQGLQQDLSPTAHFLIRLRVIHPLIAVISGIYIVFLAIWSSLKKDDPDVRRYSLALMLLFGTQLAAGTVNLVLLAPIWMQVVHLLLADLTWIALVLLAAAIFSKSPRYEISRR